MALVTNTPIRDLLFRVGELGDQVLNSINEKALYISQYSDMKAVLPFMQANNDMRLPVETLLSKKTVANGLQGQYIDYLTPPSGTVSNNLTLAFSDTINSQRYSVQVGAPISRKLTLKLSDLLLFDTPLSTQQRFDVVMLTMLKSAAYSIIEEYNKQFVLWLDANKQTGGGFGTKYTVGGDPDVKAIPATDPNVFQGMYLDAILSNRTISSRKGIKADLIATKNIFDDAEILKQLKTYNQRDAISQVTEYFNMTATDSFDATQTAPPVIDINWDAYVVDASTVYCTTWTPDVDMAGMFNMGNFGNKDYTKVAMPASLLPEGVPSLDFGLYVQNDFVNSFAAAPNDVEEFRIDKQISFMPFARPVYVQKLILGTQPSANIIKYQKLV